MSKTDRMLKTKRKGELKEGEEIWVKVFVVSDQRFYRSFGQDGFDPEGRIQVSDTSPCTNPWENSLTIPIDRVFKGNPAKGVNA